MTPQPGDRIRVDVPAPAAPSYEVIVRNGALDDLAMHVAAAAPSAACAVISPDALAGTYGGRAVSDLRAAGMRAELLTFDDAEMHKTRDTWALLTDRMLALRFGRDTCVVAVGGGVTGDIAGFVAATYMRGIPCVQVPTTLLAMIDASIGGKTGVDTDAGKNLVGAFHQPAVVVSDPAVLRTLPAVQLRSGLAEAVKHGAILDARYFHWIDANVDALLALDSAALEHLIARSVQLKTAVVTDDPFESGRRAILNFGHTVGHAVERAAEYTMPHGFAVSIGMCVEAALGEALGVTADGTSGTVSHLLARLDLPVRTTCAPSDLIDAMSIDKKARAAQPRFALLRTIGECADDAHGAWTHEVPGALLNRVLSESGATTEAV